MKELEENVLRGTDGEQLVCQGARIPLRWGGEEMKVLMAGSLSVLNDVMFTKCLAWCLACSRCCRNACSLSFPFSDVGDKVI